MAKYECEGQLSLFDFLESPKQENNVDRQRKIELEVVDMILNWTIANCRGWSKLPREERIKKAKEHNSGSAGARQGYLWKCDANGIDITFDEPIGKCLAVHIGWPMFDNRVFGKESKAAEQFECDGCIFETKSKCCGYNTKDDYCVLGNKKITNKLIKQLIDDLEAMYPGKIDGIEYTVWEHVPNLGKRLWLNIEDVGDTWDLTGIIDKYKEASLEVSISAVPHFVGGGNVEGNNLYVSTMWKTKGHKEVLEYEFKTEAAGQNVCKFSEHTCNKEELWKVAESFDDIECPKICCRQCKVKCCGARCNGSEEPKEEEPKCSKAKECEAYPTGCGGSIEPCRFGGPFRWWPKESNEAAVDYETWHDIEEPPPENAFCLFEYLWTRHQKEDSSGRCEGWWKNGKVTWMNMPWDIGKKRVTRWKFKEEEKEEPKEVNVRGLLDDGYCPECNMCLDDLVERCPSCGTLLSWNEWRKANGEAESG